MSDCCTLAYLAGIVDGEGWIGITRRGHWFSEAIRVEQATSAAVDLLQEVWPAYRRTYVPRRGHHRMHHAWTARDSRAAACLVELLPYLRIKRTQAENALALRSLKQEGRSVRVGRRAGRGRPYPPDFIARLEELFVKSKELNLNGRALVESQLEALRHG